MKTIEDYAKGGEHYDVMQALELLTKAYISMCGISMGCRTVVYCAAEAWYERLAWLDQPLSEMARKEPLVCAMPYITSEYDPAIYDKYDITGMSNDELQSGCRAIVNDREFDEPTNEVLCWGLLKAIENSGFKPLNVEVEATAPDGTILRGVLIEQRRWITSLTMSSPYKNLSITKHELIRDPKELLIKGYEDYQRLHSMEDAVRALYPKYQEGLEKCDSHRKKYRLFDDVYASLLGDCALLSPEKLFSEWFGLEFFVIK